MTDSQPQLLAAIPEGSHPGAGTRTSEYWSFQPADPLHLRTIWPQVNKWGIPCMDAAPAEPPAAMAAWGDRGDHKPGVAIHCFTDDYRMEATWSRPLTGLARVQVTGQALSPDFSLWTGMPLAAQLWQVYRSRWVGAFWQYHGIRVWPSVSWSSPESYEFCFAGLPARGPVAVSTVGIRTQQARDLWRAGLAECVRQVQPARLLVYGEHPEWAADFGVSVSAYPSRWATRMRGAGHGRTR